MLVDAIRKEYRDRGYSKVIRIATALTPNAVLQYGRDSEDLKSGRRFCGVFNTINIINQSDALIAILPDFVESKMIMVPAGIIIGKDGISFQEFEIRNIDSTETADANTVTITFGFEPPLMREKGYPRGAR